MGVLLAVSLGTRAQGTFPYVSIPDSLVDGQERLAYMLEHFWCSFDFGDSTETNLAVAEQGFVDYVNLMQHADSAVAARSAAVFVASLADQKGWLSRMEELMDHYLGNPQSPVRDDGVYAHLLRAMPVTPQRTYLLGRLSQNQLGMVVNDIPLMDGQGLLRGEDKQSLHSEGWNFLHEVESPFVLLVLYDPDCEQCRELLAQIRENQPLNSRAKEVKVLYIDTALHPSVNKAFYLPSLPSLYLLDAQKRVLLKDAKWMEVREFLGL